MISKNTRVGRWPLASVTRLIRGDDGRFRSTELRTTTGVHVRRVSKLCLLEEGSNSYTKNI